MKSQILKRLRSDFIAGLLFIIPLALTVYVVVKLFQWLDGLLSGHVSQAIYVLFDLQSPVRPIPGIGLLALLLLLLITGIGVRNYIGSRLVKLSDFILNRIPLVKHIYGTLHQVGHAFLSDRGETFKRAVLFEYPRPGIYSIGFITQDTKGLVQRALFQTSGKDVYSIFLPTTPNPTSGYLLFVPKDDVISLNISIEEALKLIISGGSIVPTERIQKDESIDNVPIVPES